MSPEGRGGAGAGAGAGAGGGAVEGPIPAAGQAGGATSLIHAAITFRRDVPDPGHDLLRAFRSGDPAAAARVEAAARAALDALPDLAPPGTLAVAVPGHLVGSRNAPCAALLRAIGPSQGWTVAPAGLLTRIADAPEGKRFGPRDAAAEAATLAWDAALEPADTGRILLVDDVVASGASLRAAAAAIPGVWRERTALLAAFRSTTG